jgi:DNA-binding response OmpR family regulator
MATGTILLLASDPVIRKAFSRALESAGYSVLAVGDVGGAVDWLKDCTPDLLMIRHYTESISGHEAAVYLRTKAPGIPVLMVGGLLDEVGLENRELIEGFEVFPKPFTASQLLDKVKEVLGKYSLRPGAHHRSG